MLEYNEITVHKVIIYEGEPYEVLTAHVFRKQQRKPVNATKLRNVMTGRIVEYSFHVNEKAEEANIEKKQVKYLYAKQGLPAGRQGEYWFCDSKDPSNRFELHEDLIGDAKKFLKPNMLVDVKLFGDKYIGVALPIKIELAVKEAAPGVKGDTAKGGMKRVTLETGAIIDAPLFVSEGDIVRVNTETGEYVERVGK